MCVYVIVRECREMDDTINPTIQFVQTDEPCQFPTELHVTQQPPPVLDHHHHHHLLISTSLPQDYHPIRSASNTRLSSSSQPSMSADSRESTDKRSEEKMMKKKKVIHRDIERPRRQEMAALYGSLRSELPLEYLRGKRSVADQMHEAAKYVKHVEKRIRELKAKRGELRRIRSDSSVARSNRPIECLTAVSGHEDNAVMVSLSGSTGVEVAINTDVDRGLPLGRVLEVLIGEGLIINCCNSTRADGRLLHSIQCEIIDAEGADATELQQKIKDLKV